MSKLRVSLTTSLLLIFSTAAPMAAHSSEPVKVGSVGIRISEIPADVSENPYSKVYIVSRLQPGVVLTQRLEVFNTSTQEFKVDLYPGLATFRNDKFEIGEGRLGNKLTSWTKLIPNTLKVKPGQSKFFNMVITPPDDALSITQFGVIWAEVSGSPNEAGITSVSRVGIRMYVPVGDSADPFISKGTGNSSTNEIVVKKSLVSSYILEVIAFSILLAIIFLVLAVIFYRRDPSHRKSRKRNEKLLAMQWRRERDRRRQIWKEKRHMRDPRDHREPPRSFDGHEEEHY